MAYQMTVTLTDQEYAALTAEANKRGTQPEEVFHEIIQKNKPNANDLLKCLQVVNLGLKWSLKIEGHTNGDLLSGHFSHH